MVRVVHCQRRDAITPLHAEIDQGGGKFARVGGDLAPVRSRFTRVGPARDDFSITMFARRMVDQIGYA